MSARRRRRVAVVTGTRAEYGLLRSAMTAIQRSRRQELQLVVTGMHLLKKFGRTIDEIVADGWQVDARVPMQTGQDERLDQATGLSRGVSGMAGYFERAKTDVVIVLGDRIEAMAGALAAVTSGRILAHIHGGDVAPGDLDEGLRHAITKLAHIHLAATEQAARRIVRLGERPEYVHTVGAPGLDRMFELLRARSQARQSKSDTALILQHPAGRSAARERQVMSALLGAVSESGLTPLVIYPNSDPGHAGVIQAIETAARKLNSLRVERSLARDEYLTLLAEARVLVGNSSSGIIEAASAGTPAVNVGDRQQGRQRSGRSVIDCGEVRGEVRAAIARALRCRPRLGGRTCYGDGQAGKRIADILARTPLTDEVRRKRLTY